MSVVARKRVKGTTYYVTFVFNGETVWERAGNDKQLAQRLEAKRRREVKAGTYVPLKNRKSAVFGRYLREAIAHRKGRNARLEEKQVLRFVVESDAFAWLTSMHIADIRPKHVLDMFEQLCRTESPVTKKPISEKYATNIYGTIRQVFRTAAFHEVIESDPCASLPKGTFHRIVGAKRAIYTRDEMARLIDGVDREPAARMFASLALLTGMREGEVCGRRFRDIDGNARPLARMTVASQYDDRMLKTERRPGQRTRAVPVHPELARVLEWWRSTGFERVYLRAPSEDDFIIPRRRSKSASASEPLSRSAAYNLWRRACDAVGVENRSLHSTRHTFVTYARQDSGQKDVVARITHNAKGDVLDGYTHYDWETLCRAVICLRVPRHGKGGSDGRVDADVDAASDSSGESGHSAGSVTPHSRSNKAEQLGTAHGAAHAGTPCFLGETPAPPTVPAARQRPASTGRGARLRHAIHRAKDAAYAGDERTCHAEMARAARLLGEAPVRRRAGGAR